METGSCQTFKLLAHSKNLILDHIASNGRPGYANCKAGICSLKRKSKKTPLEAGNFHV